MDEGGQAPTSLLKRYGAALKYSDYRRFWISATIAGAGVWGLIVARGLLAFDISDQSAGAVGITTFAALIPFVLVPPFSGILADKMDRRFLIAAAHAANVILALILVVLYFFGDIQLWQVVLMSLLSGIARGVQLPSQSALVPNLVGKDDILNAIALNNLSLQGARLMGGVIVGLLANAEWGIGAAFILAVGGYAIASVVVLTIRTASTGAIARGDSVLTVITAGVVYAWRTPAVGLMLLFVAFHCGMTMAFESVIPLHAQDQWNSGGSAFANYVAALGAGAAVGVLFVAGLQSGRRKGQALLLTAFGSSIGIMIVAFSTSQAVGLAGAFVMGLTQAPFMSLSIAFIQGVVPDAIRGRVSSLFAMSALSLMAITNYVYGLLADAFGSVAVLVVPGSVFVGIVVIALVGSGILRTIMTTGFDVGAPTRAPGPAPTGGSS